MAGTLAQVNADLASLEDKDSSANPDTLAIVATDTTTKSSAGRFVGVTVIGAPVITAPTNATVTAGLDSLASQIRPVALGKQRRRGGDLHADAHRQQRRPSPSAMKGRSKPTAAARPSKARSPRSTPIFNC